MSAERALASPVPIRNHTNPETDRAIVYYIQRGASYTDDIITKYLEISSSADEPPFLRIKLPSKFINRHHQYQQRLGTGLLPPSGSTVPLDEDSEEEYALRLLHPKQVKSSFFQEASTDAPSSSKSLASASEAAGDQRKLSSLMGLPWDIRKWVIAWVLQTEMSNSCPCIEDLETLPAIFRTCQQLKVDAIYLWSNSGLRILTPLPPNAGTREERQRHGVQVIHGDSTISHVTVDVPLVYTIAEDSYEDFVAAFSTRPGLHQTRELLCVDTSWDYVEAINVYSAHTLAQKMAPVYGIADARGFVATVAPTTHGNLFGWMRYAKLNVECLTIEASGMELWNALDFAAFRQYRALPIIALIASVIAHKPMAVRKIVLRGLGIFQEIVEFLWQSIPERTPLTGQNPLLDQLVTYPFEGGLTNIERVEYEQDGTLRRVPRQGNLFGLRSEMGWQSLILKARHGIHDAAWEFHA